MKKKSNLGAAQNKESKTVMNIFIFFKDNKNKNLKDDDENTEMND